VVQRWRPLAELGDFRLSSAMFRLNVTAWTRCLSNREKSVMANDVRVVIKTRNRDGALDVDIDIPPIPLGSESRTQALAHAGERDTYELELTPEVEMTQRSTKLRDSPEVRAIGARQRTSRLMTRNQATINRLSPGRYLVRYRVTRLVGGKKIQFHSEAQSINIR
jgi:hypothetical protein